MDKKVLDLVSTKYLSQKLVIEIELEKLINNPPADLNPDQLTLLIMTRVSDLRNTISNSQTWEGIIGQQIKNPEEGE
jgi:hypothetical protein